MRLIRPALVIAALAALLPLSSASAVGTFGGVVHYAPSGCSLPVVGMGGDGLTRGYVNCGSGLRYVQGSGTHWTSSAVSFSGQVVAVAVSGTTTWFLLTTSTGLYVKSRSGSGSLSAARKLSSSTGPAGVALAAYGGQWWAIWGEGTSNSGFSLFEAHTLAGTGATRRAYGSATSAIADAYPAVAWLPTTKTAVIAWTHGRSQGTFSVVRTTSKGGSWAGVSSVDSAGSGPVLATSGATVILADAHGSSRGTTLGIYVGAASGAMSLHAASLPAAGGISVAVSSGRITAGYNGYSSAGVVPRVVERNGATWSEATFNQPSGGRVVATESFGGRARVFFDVTSGAPVVRSQ